MVLNKKLRRRGDKKIPRVFPRAALNIVPTTFPPDMCVNTMQLDIVVGRHARAMIPILTFGSRIDPRRFVARKKKAGITKKMNTWMNRWSLKSESPFRIVSEGRVAPEMRNRTTMIAVLVMERGFRLLPDPGMRIPRTRTATSPRRNQFFLTQASTVDSGMKTRIAWPAEGRQIVGVFRHCSD